MRFPSPPAIDLRRCGHGEEALFTRDGKFLLNPHNHTTDSDGAHDIARVASLAEEHGVNVAVTEHNLPPRRVNGKWLPGLVAGMEVLTQEGVDVVVLGTLENVHRLFEERIRPAFRHRKPQYRPIGLPVADLLELIPQYGLWAIHPHYASVEGLSMLTSEAQRKALETARGRTFMEVNALVSADGNALAGELAAEWDLPVLTGGDTHRGEHHYVGNYSSVAASAVDTATGALPDRLFQALHARQSRSDDRLLDPGWLEKTAIGIHVARANGPRVIALYVAKAAGRVLGVLHTADERNIPKRTSRTPQAAA